MFDLEWSDCFSSWAKLKITEIVYSVPVLYFVFVPFVELLLVVERRDGRGKTRCFRRTSIYKRRLILWRRVVTKWDELSRLGIIRGPCSWIILESESGTKRRMPGTWYRGIYIYKYIVRRISTRCISSESGSIRIKAKGATINNLPRTR